MGSSLHRSAGPARSLLQRGVPTGSQPPSGTHLLRRGVLHGLQVEICSTVDLPGLQGDSLPHQGLHHGLQGNLRSGAWSISSPSFFTDLVITRYFLPLHLLRTRADHTLPLLQRGVPPTGDSPPRTPPTWAIPTGCSSSRTAPAWVHSTVCSPSGAHCSSAGPPRGHKSCQKTCSMGSSLHRSAGPARSLLQCGVPTGSQPPSGTHLLRRGVLHGLQVDICSIVDLHGLQGDSLPHQGLHHGLQGNLHSGAWSISSPSFFIDLGVHRLVSPTCSHSSPRGCFSLSQLFFSFLKMLSQRRYHYH
ncbi:uncharacterized protein LOC126035356 [Accipiter gentilis]|uniref:uncharacterized protein LOC126035356 n=1 Tax=Astur gentilis TaxID=8957 RepID=UPI002110348D|nr:uncharacterized protein LOC126035356 [Accipiter gentilis]